MAQAALLTPADIMQLSAMSGVIQRCSFPQSKASQLKVKGSPGNGAARPISGLRQSFTARRVPSQRQVMLEAATLERADMQRPSNEEFDRCEAAEAVSLMLGMTSILNTDCATW